MTGERSSAKAAWLGACWGVGHTLTLLTTGALLVMSRAEMPAIAAQVFEFCVVLLLVGFGVRAIYQGACRVSAGPTHSHRKPGTFMSFPVDRWTVARPLLVGAVHGLAGSGALTALVVTTLPSTATQLGYLTLFGVGSIVGMAALSGLMGWPIARVGAHRMFARTISLAVGSVSTALGLFWGYPLIEALVLGAQPKPATRSSRRRSIRMIDNKPDRRTFLGTVGAAAALTLARDVKAHSAFELVTGITKASYDVVVIGAGCFGAWTAWHLRKAGRSVLLLDRYGPANARASSGGESRIIRMSYGPDEVYTRFSNRSLGQWKAFFAAVGRPELFQGTGVLWMARGEDPRATASLRTLAKEGIPHERLDENELRKRYPADRDRFRRMGDLGARERGAPGKARGAGGGRRRGSQRSGLRGCGRSASGGQDPARGDQYRRRSDGASGSLRVRVRALAWQGRTRGSGRAHLSHATAGIFFGVPAGDSRFAPPAMPTWIDFDGNFYGMPDLETRGFKVAADAHGPAFDPDSGERVVTPEATREARTFLARRFPGLKAAPIVETRVCQYENTSNGDFVIDRLPSLENVWVVGGGSGHGFKHGPAVGEYTAERVLKGGAGEPRFSLASKGMVQKRVVQ